MSRPDNSEEGAYAPLAADGFSDVFVERIEVDGETFRVRRRVHDGSHHYDWVSGPNDGYGFSVSRRPEPLGRAQHDAEIRNFLAAIDPTTGYL